MALDACREPAKAPIDSVEAPVGKEKRTPVVQDKDNDAVMVKTGEIVDNNGAALGAGLVGLSALLGSVFGWREWKN